MGYREKLFRWKDPFDHAGTEELFRLAMGEACRFAYDHCPDYRKILDALRFRPEEAAAPGGLERLPALPTLLFKRRRLFCVPERRMLLRATSSGTSGSFSEIGFTAGDLLRGAPMVLKTAGSRSLFSPVPCHYIVLGYQPHKSNRAAAVKTAMGATFFAPALSRTFALRYADGRYRLDLEGLAQAVRSHARSPFPTRLVGFPAYVWFLMELLEQRGVSLRLPKGSKLLLGGGWKQFSAGAADKGAFYALAEKTLGLAGDDIVEFFSAVEHPILYCDCPRRRLHVPVYSRVIIRDPKTLEPAPNGVPGLVNLLTPMVKATPILSVMTDDLGILHDADSCGCGRRAPWLELLGRAGLEDIRTCAAGAAELLGEVEL